MNLHCDLCGAPIRAGEESCRDCGAGKARRGAPPERNVRRFSRASSLSPRIALGSQHRISKIVGSFLSTGIALAIGAYVLVTAGNIAARQPDAQPSRGYLAARTLEGAQASLL